MFPTASPASVLPLSSTVVPLSARQILDMTVGPLPKGRKAPKRDGVMELEEKQLQKQLEETERKEREDKIKKEEEVARKKRLEEAQKRMKINPAAVRGKPKLKRGKRQKSRDWGTSGVAVKSNSFLCFFSDIHGQLDGLSSADEEEEEEEEQWQEQAGGDEGGQGEWEEQTNEGDQGEWEEQTNEGGQGEMEEQHNDNEDNQEEWEEQTNQGESIRELHEKPNHGEQCFALEKESEERKTQEQALGQWEGKNYNTLCHPAAVKKEDGMDTTLQTNGEQYEKISNAAAIPITTAIVTIKTEASHDASTAPPFAHHHVAGAQHGPSFGAAVSAVLTQTATTVGNELSKAPPSLNDLDFCMCSKYIFLTKNTLLFSVLLFISF
jgi:hypothetical protein